MRIISKYKDYYDNAMAYGIDSTQVFVRNEEYVKVPITKENEHVLDEYRYFGMGSFYSKPKPHNELKIELDYILLGFCGKHFLGLKFEVIKGQKEPIASETYYTPEQIRKGFLKLASQYDLDLPKGKVPETADRLGKRFVDKDTSIKALTQSRLFQSWFFTFNCPTFSITPKACSPSRFTSHFGENYYPYRNKILVLHPCLKDIDFYRRMNPFECYQNINQYRFGVLGNNEDGHSTQSDIEKVQSHGFDMKYGFRKRPKEK